MKFTVTFIGIVLLVFVALFIINNQKANQNEKDLNSIMAEATKSGQLTQTQQRIPSTPIASTSPTQGELKTATKAVIKTSKGDITITLYPDIAPKTVSNFVTKSESTFYDGLTFHRVEDWVVQGGDPKGDGTGGNNMPVEFSAKPFVKGSVGVASRGDNVNQNDAQFFIVKEEADWLDRKYTNFGIVTDGMDVVEKIAIGDKIISITTE